MLNSVQCIIDLIDNNMCIYIYIVILLIVYCTLYIIH